MKGATIALANGRREFIGMLEQSLERLHRREVASPAAMIFAEIDACDLMNDWYGYREVDGLLQRMQDKLDAQLRLLAAVRSGEFLFGRGIGAGFAIALFGEVANDAAIIAESLRAAVQGAYLLDGQPRNVTCSLGCTMPEPLPNPDQLIGMARAALRRALELGGGRVEFGQRDGLAAQTRARILGRDLQLAISQQQLRLEYQPIVNLEHMAVEGIEALLRWEHPLLGMVSPGEFIPIAARSAYLGVLGDWVLENACPDFARIRARGDLPGLRFLSVNVSRQNLGDRGLPAKVLAALSVAGMAPEQLHLEITESELIGNPDLVDTTLRGVRALGAKLAIDDFGVGHSSLASLRQLPVDMLKLDRSFLSGQIGGREGRDFLAIAHAIVNLARNVELDVVAEGVENVEQVALLHSLQCPLAQGYFLCRPMPLERLAEGCRHFIESAEPQALAQLDYEEK